jgi:nucleoside-diphosphate-sugar epimerase
MRKKILITGSLGYLGSVMVPYLEEQDFKCVGVDPGFFKDCVFSEPKEQKVISKSASEITKKELKEVYAVVHLAGISNDPFGNLPLDKIYEPTRAYSLRLAKLCKELGIKFIFASSCSIYGKAIGKGFLDEESEPNPQTPYSVNKLQIEQDLTSISDKKFKPIILRFATAFGNSPRIRFDLVINMLVAMAVTKKKIILNSDGKAWRPFVHIEDICKAVRYAIEFEPSEETESPLVLNVGDSTQNFQIIDIARMVKEAVPSSEIEFLDVKSGGKMLIGEELIRDRKISDSIDSRTYKVSFDKIKRVFLGFECGWTVRIGIEELVRYFRSIGLTEEKFKKKDYYRLQKFEQLLNDKIVEVSSFGIMWCGGGP